MMGAPQSGSRLRRFLNPFDLVVLCGAAVNALVVVFLVGYWLLYG